MEHIINYSLIQLFQENQAKLLMREREVLQYAKVNGFKVVGTFNMTMARYKDFTEGKCACHFHRVSMCVT